MANPARCAQAPEHQAAAVMLWRRAGHGTTQVYVVQRAGHLAHYAKFWAFPGGRVDPCDRLEPQGDAWVMAAARELFEETGILMVTGASTTVLSKMNLQALRAGLHAAPHRFAQALAAAGLAVDAAAFVPCGRWLTPPFGSRIFDAQYFAVQAPEAQPPQLDAHEASCGRWQTAAQALHEHVHGEQLFIYPVLATLNILAAAQSVCIAAERAQAASPSFLRRFGPLLPGVRMLPLRSPTLPPATHTNCMILGDKELAVVDPGTPYDADRATLLGVLRELEAGGARLTQIWLTHAHPDHTYAISFLQRHFASPVYAHADTAADLAAARLPAPAHTLNDGQSLRLAGGFAWEVLHTPGHARGHLCFYEPRLRVLLAGDNVLGVGTSMVPPAPHGSMAAYMHSLQRMLQLDARLLLPGHGPPVAAVAAAIANTQAQRLARERQIVAALAGAPQSLEALVAQVYAHTPADRRKWARLSMLAHLEKLVDDGVATCDADGYKVA